MERVIPGGLPGGDGGPIHKQEAVPGMAERLCGLKVVDVQVKVIVLFFLQAKEVVRESTIIALPVINYTNTTVIKM